MLRDIGGAKKYAESLGYFPLRVAATLGFTVLVENTREL
jgi:hypothetical protein